MIIGITGGIGSGKTYCAQIFEEIGVPVYYSDDRAKRLMVTSDELIQSIKTLLGDAAYTKDGMLDRAYVASQIFKNEDLLKQMNAIVHPAVRDDFISWGAQQLHVHPYVMQESALMYETGSYRFFDRVIVVDAPVDVRVDRVMARDRTTREGVLARIDKQLPSVDKRSKADYVIENDGKQSIIPQILEVHRDLMTEIGPATPPA